MARVRKTRMVAGMGSSFPDREEVYYEDTVDEEARPLSEAELKKTGGVDPRPTKGHSPNDRRNPDVVTDINPVGGPSVAASATAGRREHMEIQSQDGTGTDSTSSMRAAQREQGQNPSSQPDLSTKQNQGLGPDHVKTVEGERNAPPTGAPPQPFPGKKP